MKWCQYFKLHKKPFSSTTYWKLWSNSGLFESTNLFAGHLLGHLIHLRQTSLIPFLLCSKTVNGHLSGIGPSERIHSETPCEVYGKSLGQNHSTKRSVNFFPPEPWEWLIRWYLRGDITLWLIGHQHKPRSWYLPQEESLRHFFWRTLQWEAFTYTTHQIHLV